MGPLKTPNYQSSPEEEEQSSRHATPRLRTILQIYNNQNSMVSPQNKHMDQQNRIESAEISPHTYGELIYKVSCFFNKWCWKSWTASFESKKLNHTFTPYTKVNYR